MYSKKVKIKTKHGIHMRPASLIMKAALATEEDVIIKKDNFEINAKSIISIVTLGAKKSSVVEISSNDKQVVDQIVEILKTKNL